MNTQMQAVAEFTLPEWAIVAIEYGDIDHLTDQETALVGEFVAGVFTEYGLGHFSFGDDVEFTRFNDLDNLAGNTVSAVYYAEASL